MQSEERITPKIKVLNSKHLYINDYLVDMTAIFHELRQETWAAHREWQDACFLQSILIDFTRKPITDTLIWMLQNYLAHLTGRRRRLFYIPDEPFIISCHWPFSRVGDERVMSTRWAIKTEPSHKQISTHWYDLREGAMTGEWPEQRYQDQAARTRTILRERAEAKRVALL